jgi:hypothetical protein
MNNTPFLNSVGVSRLEAEGVLAFIDKAWNESDTLTRFLDEVALKRRVWKSSEAYLAGIASGMLIQCEICGADEPQAVKEIRRIIQEAVILWKTSPKKDGVIVEDGKPPAFPPCFGEYSHEGCKTLDRCPFWQLCCNLTSAKKNRDKTIAEVNAEDAALQASFSDHERR